MNRLKELRMERGLSLRGCEKIFNLHFSTISGYEDERRDIPSTLIKDFSKFYQVSCDYLLGSDKEIYCNIEESKIIISFNRDEYIKYKELNNDSIYFKDGIRYIKLDELKVIAKLQESIIKNADKITSVPYNLIEEN